MSQNMNGAGAANADRTIRVKILRQDKPRGDPNMNLRWEEFDIPWKPGMNINGHARMACSALVDKLEQPIALEPLTSFPVVRDLIVDRSRVFDVFKRVHAWVPIDGTYDLGPGPKMNEADRQISYVLSTCMTCGACLEACPNVNDSTPFIGAFAINQVRLFNSHPTGAMIAEERLEALMDEGGIAYCGNDQNCVRVCPKGIPLTDSIAEMNRQVNFYALKSLLSK